jgi:hypothetical protein
VLGQDARQQFFDEPLAASTECNAYEQVIYRRAKFVEVLRRDGAHSSWGRPLGMGYIEERTVNKINRSLISAQS